MLTGKTMPKVSKVREEGIADALKLKVEDERVRNLILGTLKTAPEQRISFQGLISSGILLSCSETD